MTPPPVPVDLSNCDQEPIHVPGLIQAHGALLAVDAELRVVHACAHLAERVPGAPALGEQLTPAHFGGQAQVHALLAQRAAERDLDDMPEGRHASLPIDGQPMDLLVHAHAGLVIAEFEPRVVHAGAPEYTPTLRAATQLFSRKPSLQGLLDDAVRIVRRLTGFDRVMAYRFRADDSGDIVSELREPDMDPYLGQRFPAGDIPAQARRLYTENTLRLIADVDSVPVPVLAAPGVEGALDMSHAVLRSVSPIHIEYLQNIGVRASMSISIVIDGRLWGMLACHHRTPLQVPYAIRATCAVLVDLLSAHLQNQLASDQAAEERAHERLRAHVLDRVQYATQPAQVLAEESAAIARGFGADAVLVSNSAGVHCHGDVPPALQRALAAWLLSLKPRGERLLVTDSIAALAPQLRDQLEGWAGLLAMGYDPFSNGGLVLLRREQVHTVDWSHHPDKPMVSVGPAGARLTPSGSVAVWRDTVREHAEPWSRVEIEAMRDLRSDLQRIVSTRVAELERYRAAVTGMLATGVTSRDQNGAAPDDRIDRLLRQVMELGLLRQGRMELVREPIDLSALVARQLDVALKSHAGAAAHLERLGNGGQHEPLTVHGDGERLAQLVDHLLDNAFRHGAMGEAVVVRLVRNGTQAQLEVSNISPPIVPALAELLFSAVIPSGVSDSSAGLGYGLYMCQTIAQAHGGDLSYAHEDPFVTMTVTLPLADSGA